MLLIFGKRVRFVLAVSAFFLVSTVAFQAMSQDDVQAAGGSCSPDYSLDWVEDSSVLDCDPSKTFNAVKCNGMSFGVVKNGQYGNQFPFPLKVKKGYKQYCDPYGINMWEKRSKFRDDALTVCLSNDLSGPWKSDRTRVAEFKKTYDYKECFKDVFNRLQKELKGLKIKPEKSGQVLRACTTGNVTGTRYPQLFNAMGCMYGFSAKVQTGKYKSDVFITIKSEFHTKKVSGTQVRGESLARFLISINGVS